MLRERLYARSSVFSLYRRIFRAHRQRLPAALRFLGDSYVRDEWHRHASVNDSLAKQFVNEWKKYVEDLEKNAPILGGEKDKVSGENKSENSNSNNSSEINDNSSPSIIVDMKNNDFSSLSSIGRELPEEAKRYLQAEQMAKLKELETEAKKFGEDIAPEIKAVNGEGEENGNKQ